MEKVKSFLGCSKTKTEDGGGFGAGEAGEGEECVKFNYTISSTLIKNSGGFWSILVHWCHEKKRSKLTKSLQAA